MPEELTKLVRRDEVVIPGTDVIDFSKIVKITYWLLIFMDNAAIVDDFWQLLVTCSGRDKQFPNVEWKDHVLGPNELKRIADFADMDDSSGVLDQLMKCATQGNRRYITCLLYTSRCV